MARKVVKWAAKDGTEFVTEELANQYDSRCIIADKLMEIISRESCYDKLETKEVFNLVTSNEDFVNLVIDYRNES